MNDDELGRALGTVLAAPEVSPAPDAGARLRARAQRARTERLAIGGTVVVVLALLLTVAVVRGTGGGAPATPTAAPPSGYRLLTTPLTITLPGPAPSPGPCTAGAELSCGPAALVVDDVAEISTTDLPERGVVIVITLTGTDAATLRAVVATGPGRTVSMRVGQSGYVATVATGRLRILMASTQSADAFLAELGPFRPAAPRTGPGRLDLPLQIWIVAATPAFPCRLSAGQPGVLTVNTVDECLVLHGPELKFGTADLEIRAPDAGSSQWRVVVGLDAADRRAVADYTRAHPGRRIAFVAGGRMLPGTGSPTIKGQFSTGFELVVDDRAGADALISRLRR
jgi:hypothetical protein